MTAIHSRDVPTNTLLSHYSDGAGFADCYVAEVPGSVSQPTYVEAFYTSALFKVERNLLRVLASMPASDADARELAAGRTTRFSAWRVESQSPTELLLADVTGRTRSWLMAVPDAEKGTTLLYFGSAVVSRDGPGTRPRMGWVFHALLGFPRRYSHWLLAAASRRVAPRP
jgi:hypothetical protein